MLNSHKQSLFDKYTFQIYCWGVVFAFLLVVFLFYLSSFYVGNHDYRFMRYGVPLTSGVFEGRLTQFVLPWLLFDGQVLPILPVLSAFLCFSLAAVLLADWYGVRQKSVSTVVFCLLIVLHPYILTQLYYVHSVLSVFCWPLVCVVGLRLIASGISAYRAWRWLSGIFLLFFSISGYAATFELALVLVLGKLGLDITAKEKLDRRFWRMYGFIFACVLATALLYWGLIRVLKHFYVVSLGMYNVQMLSVSGMFFKFMEKWSEPWSVLAQPLPYCSWWQPWCLLGLGCMALVAAYNRRRFGWMAACLVLLVYVSFTMAFMSPFDFFSIYRICFFSVPYLAAIMFACLVCFGRKWQRNAALGLALVLVCCFVRADFTAQKVWHLGDKLDEWTADRVRQELTQHMVPGKHYRLLVHGGFYGREKMAGISELSAQERECGRELYGYSKFLTHNFSSGLFLYEKENPIWGDALFAQDDIIYILSGNEELAQQDKKTRNAAVFFALKEDDSAPLSQLDRISIFPYRYYYIGDKTIYLRLCLPKPIERF